MVDFFLKLWLAFHWKNTRVSPLFIFSIENMDIKKFMREVITIYQGSTFKEALQIMTTKGCNSLLVVDNNEKLVWGIDIVTLTKAAIPEYLWNEKHLAHFTTDSFFDECLLDVQDKQVKDFMMSFTKVIKLNTSMMEAAIIVTEWRQTKIPVLDENEKPIGVFTRSSLKKMLAWELWIK